MTEPAGHAAPAVFAARNGVFWFAGFLAAVLAAFWPTYFMRIDRMASPLVHLHGALLFGWCLLLVAQAGLMRGGQRAVHRRLGRLAWVLGPAIVVSSLAVEHGALRRAAGKLGPEDLYFAYVIASLLLLFALTFGLAMFHRRRPALHARYMLCTPLTMIDPVFARILGVHFDVPYVTGQFTTYGMTDVVLAALWVADRRSGHGVFPRMLVAFVLLQAPTFFVYRTAWWAQLVASVTAP